MNNQSKNYADKTIRVTIALRDRASGIDSSWGKRVSKREKGREDFGTFAAISVDERDG